MRRVGSATGVASLLLASVFAVAWAHATLLRSNPASNAHLSRPPAELELEFSEAVAPRTSRVEVVTPDSQRLALVLRGDSANPKALFAEVPTLAIAGRYRVEWRLVGTDGHAVTGQYAFIVDSIPVSPVDSVAVVQPPATPNDVHEPSGDSLFQRAIRFLSFLAMLVVIGSVAFALFVLPAATGSTGDASVDFGQRVDRRLRSLSTIGAWSLLILAVVRLASHGIVLSGSLQALRFDDLADLVMGSTFGRGWLLQVAAIIALLFGLLSSRPMRWGAIAGFAGALAISASFLGHPAAAPDVPGLAMSLDALHLLAAGGWAGGIIVLAAAALPQILTVPRASRVEAVRGLLRAFSPLALRSAAILAVTGAIGGWLQLGDPGLILGSDYGLALFRKVVVVLMVAALGAYHWRVVQPSVGSDRSIGWLRASIVLDVAQVLVVLVLTAILTGTSLPVR